MAKHQDREWVESQKIIISMNLIEAAKKHLQFLEAIDKNGNLYDGPILEKAIFRYKYCWLPLLAKHTDSKFTEGQLVVPIDCEWVWHCHRLNPVRYMVDCQKLFGRILDPGYVVVSSIDGNCKKQTEEIWKKHYPEEPYELNFDDDYLGKVTESKLATLPSTDYDLISAVKRQSSFYQKVSGPPFRNDKFLEEAVKRYKGFLHLVRRNIEINLQTLCVPTTDIDLMWHTHQLHPSVYCKDVLALTGHVLHHDDTDTDKSEGSKMHVGITTTTKQWGEVFGSMYLKKWSMCNPPTMGVDEEKLTANCAGCGVKLMGEEKLTANCAGYGVKLMDEEKVIANCAGCGFKLMDKEKLTANCAGCGVKLMDVEKLTANCMCCGVKLVDEEKLITRCRCSGVKVMEGEKLSGLGTTANGMHLVM